MVALMPMSQTKPTLQGWLRVTISEPATSGTATLISVFLQFVLKCPNLACQSSHLWKDGRDASHRHQPQRLVCARCGNRFYLHTSYVFHVLSQSLLEELLEAVLRKGTPLETLAQQYHVSQAFLSGLTQRLREFLQERTTRAKKTLARKKLRNHLPQNLNHVVYMDETFLRIVGKQFKLILAIDSSGAVLGWVLRPTRTAEDIKAVLEQVLAKIERIAVLITDGFSSYKTAIKQLRLSRLHIRHIPSHPWRDVHLTAYEYWPKERLIHEVTVGIAYDAFTRPGPAFGRLFTQTRRVSGPGRGPGRPRGAKDKQPRQRRKQATPSPKGASKANSKKRGPKNVFEVGRLFQFHVEPFKQVLELEGASLGRSEKLGEEVEREEVLRLLWTAAWLFQWGYVTTNLIEGRISQIKLHLPQRGRNSEEAMKRRVEAILACPEAPEETGEAEERGILPTFPHLGFINLGAFITPQIEAMEVIRA